MCISNLFGLLWTGLVFFEVEVSIGLTTRRHYPEHLDLNLHCGESIKSRIFRLCIRTCSSYDCVCAEWTHVNQHFMLVTRKRADGRLNELSTLFLAHHSIACSHSGLAFVCRSYERIFVMLIKQVSIQDWWTCRNLLASLDEQLQK